MLQHFAILSTFIKLSFVIKIFVLSSFEWLFKTGFTLIDISPVVGQIDSGPIARPISIQHGYSGNTIDISPVVGPI